jgi:hypothetical protein
MKPETKMSVKRKEIADEMIQIIVYSCNCTSIKIPGYDLLQRPARLRNMYIQLCQESVIDFNRNL